MATFVPLKGSDGKPIKHQEVFDLAKAILEAKFPDELAAYPGTISLKDWIPATKLGNNVAGEYFSKTKSIDITHKSSFTTPAVIEMVGTILHEIQHARQDTASARANSDNGDLGFQGSDRTVGSYNLEQRAKLQSILDDAKINRLPSSDNNSEYEFLANAVPTILMQDRGINPEYAPEINKMMKNPDTAKWVRANINPELPSLRNTPPSFLDFLKSAFSGNTGSDNPSAESK